MDNTIILQVVERNRLMTDVDKLVNLFWGLQTVISSEVPGDVVEIGCHAGGTSVFLKMILNGSDPARYSDQRRRLHVYDSFQGMPSPGPRDGSFMREGDARATVRDLLASFDHWSLDPPMIHEGWFATTLPTQLPDEICFAFLDTDFYDSTMTALAEVYKRLSPGGLMFLDDYADLARNPHAWSKLPGVKASSDAFFVDKPERVYTLVGCGDLPLGYVRKLPT